MVDFPELAPSNVMAVQEERPHDQNCLFGFRTFCLIVGYFLICSVTNIVDADDGNKRIQAPNSSNSVAQLKDQPDSLPTELRSLLKNHPRLKNRRESVNALREQQRGAFSGFLPTLNLSGDSGREVVDSPGTRSSVGEPTREYRQKATLAITQNIFDGFGTTELYRQSITQTQVGEADLESVQQTLLLEGITSYYTVLRQRALVKLGTENEMILKKQLQLEDARVTRGSGIAVDVLLAKTRLQLAVEQRVQFEGDLEAANARYIQVFGHSPSLKSMKRPISFKALLPDSLDRAIKDATDKNPALLATERAIIAARHRKQGASSGFFPSVDFVVQGNWEKDVDGVLGVRRDWSALFRFSWDLFSGFSTQSAASAAAFEQAAAHDTHRDNIRTTVQNLRIAWQQYNTAKERVRLLENAVVIAEEVFVSRRRLRDAGRETAINVLDAQREVFAARINLVAAQFDAEIAAYSVMFAMGTLTPHNLGI